MPIHKYQTKRPHETIAARYQPERLFDDFYPNLLVHVGARCLGCLACGGHTHNPKHAHTNMHKTEQREPDKISASQEQCTNKRNSSATPLIHRRGKPTFDMSRRARQTKTSQNLKTTKNLRRDGNTTGENNGWELPAHHSSRTVAAEMRF